VVKSKNPIICKLFSKNIKAPPPPVEDRADTSTTVPVPVAPITINNFLILKNLLSAEFPTSLVFVGI